MYRSLYAFRSAEPNSLHFAAGESFLILERSNKHWWLGSRCSSGETGYIPSSYIEKIQVNNTNILCEDHVASWGESEIWWMRSNVQSWIDGIERDRSLVTVLYVLKCRPHWSWLQIIVRKEMHACCRIHKLLERLHYVGTWPFCTAAAHCDRGEI